MRTKLVKAITVIMAVVFAISIMAMDSQVIWIPMTALAISGTWLFLVAWANGYLGKGENENDRDY